MRTIPEYRITADTDPQRTGGGLNNGLPTAFLTPLIGNNSADARMNRYVFRASGGASFPMDSRVSRILKRIFDVIVSTFVMLLIFPWLVPLVGLLILLDSRGPVFFLQKRNGRKGRIFTCIKFRTMKVNEQADLIPAAQWDDRITRFGKFLRNYHIDEFPQFLNVLRGEMSVTGPRPHMLRDNEKYGNLIPHYSFRHEIKPGITGLAQVIGYTGEITCLEKMERRVEADIFYIRSWSFGMDIRILFKTCCSFLQSEKQFHKRSEIAWRSSLHHVLPPSSRHFDGAA